ncbi:MAG: hypothetical protein RR312_08655 [Bacteroidales bacterium]
MKLIVIKEFYDKNPPYALFREGSIIEIKDKKRAEELLSKEVVKKAE